MAAGAYGRKELPALLTLLPRRLPMVSGARVEDGDLGAESEMQVGVEAGVGVEGGDNLGEATDSLAPGDESLVPS